MLQLTKQNRSSLPLIAMLIAILLTMSGAPAQANSLAAPPDSDLTLLSAPAGAVSPEGLLNPDGTLDMSTGFRGMLDLRGWEVILDGERGPVLKPASRPVASQVTAWNALSNQGLNDDVRALAVVGSDLYVGGGFTQTGDGTLTNLGRIARYDTTAGTWNALPNQGLDGYVYTLAVVGSDLYVGGFFTQTGDGVLTNLGNIVRYDTTAGAWNALSSQGLNNTVLALIVSGSDLYVGGYFTQTGDEALTNLGCIARYDTTAGTWNALPNQGLGGGYLPMPSVRALAVSGSDLYVGGNFTRTGDGTLTNLGRIARYDTVGGTWNALPNQGLDERVYALAVSGSDLYVGGRFARTGDGVLTNLGRIARYDTVGGTWNALPNQGLDDWVRALAVVGSRLYVGGYFTQTGDGSLTNLGYIAHGTSAGHDVYLPLVAKNFVQPSLPAPVLDDISNPDGDGSYTVSWSAVSGATSYTLEEDGNTAFSSPTTVYSGPDTSTSITGRDVGTYYYRVKASNASGSSDWSNVEAVTVSPPCPQFSTGTWEGKADFTVPSDRSRVVDFEFDAYCPPCPRRQVTAAELPIVDCRIQFSASDGGVQIGGQGTFVSETEMEGSFAVQTSTCLCSGTWRSWWVSDTGAP